MLNWAAKIFNNKCPYVELYLHISSCNSTQGFSFIFLGFSVELSKGSWDPVLMVRLKGQLDIWGGSE